MIQNESRVAQSCKICESINFAPFTTVIIGPMDAGNMQLSDPSKMNLDFLKFCITVWNIRKHWICHTKNAEFLKSCFFMKVPKIQKFLHNKILNYGVILMVNALYYKVFTQHRQYI